MTTSGDRVYQTKTIRVHLPELGRYVYLLITRFDGEDHLLADDGWRGVYNHYSIISRNTSHQDAATDDVWAFIRENDWLKGTPADLVVKGLEMGEFGWSDIEDGQKLSREDVHELANAPEDEV